MRATGTTVRAFVLAAVSASIAGCAIFDPYVVGDSSSYHAQPTLQHAVEYAQSTSDAYRNAIRWQSGLNTAFGVGIIGAATAASILAVVGTSTETILRIGIGGASAYALHSFLYNRPRQQIYGEGIKSLTCGIAIFEPLRPVDAQALSARVLELRLAAAELRLSVAKANTGIDPEQPLTSRMANLENVLGSAQDTLARANTVLQAPSVLKVFVEEVNAEVTIALQREDPDISELVRSLGSSIPFNAASIAGPLPIPKTGKAESSFDPEVETLVQDAEEKKDVVTAKIESVEMLLVGIDVPDAGPLAACKAFLQLRPFRVLPSTSLLVDPSNPAPAEITVRGGTPEYQVSWLGQAPTNVGNPTKTRETMAGAVYAITAPPGTQGTYQLLVEDSAGNSVAMLVIFSSGTSPDSGATGSSSAARVPTRDPKVEQIQAGLIELQCLAPERATTTEERAAGKGDKESNKDGNWGDRTTAAYGQFVQDIFDSSAEEEPNFAEAKATLGERGDPTFYDKLNEAIETAKSQPGRCKVMAGAT